MGIKAGSFVFANIFIFAVPENILFSMAKINNFDENVKDSSVSSVEIFENSEFGKVRMLAINENPWSVGNDVASILDSNSTHK